MFQTTNFPRLLICKCVDPLSRGQSSTAMFPLFDQNPICLELSGSRVVKVYGFRKSWQGKDCLWSVQITPTFTCTMLLIPPSILCSDVSFVYRKDLTQQAWLTASPQKASQQDWPLAGNLDFRIPTILRNVKRHSLCSTVQTNSMVYAERLLSFWESRMWVHAWQWLPTRQNFLPMVKIPGLKKKLLSV